MIGTYGLQCLSVNIFVCVHVCGMMMKYDDYYYYCYGYFVSVGKKMCVIFVGKGKTESIRECNASSCESYN